MPAQDESLKQAVGKTIFDHLSKQPELYLRIALKDPESTEPEKEQSVAASLLMKKERLQFKTLLDLICHSKVFQPQAVRRIVREHIRPETDKGKRKNSLNRLRKCLSTLSHWELFWITLYCPTIIRQIALIYGAGTRVWLKNHIKKGN